MALRNNLRSLILQRHRVLSTSTSILNPDSKTPLTGRDKSRTTISLIQFETDPERILDICRAASLTPESHLDRVAYTKAISKLKESHYYDGIRCFLKESLTRSDSKSERFVSHFIVLYGQAGLVSDAVKLFDEMPEMGVERNVKTLNSLLFSCIVGKEYGQMKRIFDEFPRKYGLVPNLDTYNTVLAGFCESGSASLSHSILAEMERRSMKPNETTFSTVIVGFYAEEKFMDVGKITELMRRYGFEQGISIYNVRIQSLCKLKRSSEAKALLDAILSRGMNPTCMTYHHLIYGFCREGKLDVAKSLFEEMVSRNLKPDGKDFEAALSICKESMAKNWIPNITTMKSLVKGLMFIEKIDEARKIVERMKKKFPRSADKWIIFVLQLQFILRNKLWRLNNRSWFFSSFNFFTISCSIYFLFLFRLNTMNQ
ncbi:hypothetical protein ACJIZ3_012739 [Penstemon smallii]|uniref:Pentatricopeptide repeat-containing protein n=1 Tax=Penstemon smallii TaxID=265156 RepID=A0ABD3UP12_9LAMI